MVLEDDCEFILPLSEIDGLVELFFKSSADVRCLAYNAWTFVEIPGCPGLRRAFDAQTASCYVLKPHMLEPLIEIAPMSIEMFRAGEPYSMAAYDQVWKNLQRKHVFVVPSKRAAQERASYSDIEEVVVDYKA